MLKLQEARLIVFLLGVLHFVSGIGMLFVPSVSYVSSLSFFVTTFHTFGLNGKAHVTVGVFLAAFGASAILAILLSKHLSLKIRILMVTPQQFVQIAQFISISLAVWSGTYPDGYTPVGRGAFIFFDQLGVLLLSIYHTLWMILALMRLEREASDANS